ncbi:MAG: hypothetical protein JXR84_13575 [Anaerolineae bacterium]|nr:hypothetical protein [Anaerolineae bacterium]
MKGKRLGSGMVWVVLAVVLGLVTPVGGARPDYQIAGILRGEAPADCEVCRQLTACALVDDVERGVSLQRWYGWRAPRDEDFELIAWARERRHCAQFPRCRFVGNGRDLEVWARSGWIDSDVQVIAHCSGLGCTVCVPEVVESRLEMQ